MVLWMREGMELLQKVCYGMGGAEGGFRVGEGFETQGVELKTILGAN